VSHHRLPCGPNDDQVVAKNSRGEYRSLCHGLTVLKTAGWPEAAETSTSDFVGGVYGQVGGHVYPYSVQVSCIAFRGESENGSLGSGT